MAFSECSCPIELKLKILNMLNLMAYMHHRNLMPTSNLCNFSTMAISNIGFTEGSFLAQY